MKCYALGLGLDTFRMVALTENFRKLDVLVLVSAFRRCATATSYHPACCVLGGRIVLSCFIASGVSAAKVYAML